MLPTFPVINSYFWHLKDSTSRHWRLQAETGAELHRMQNGENKQKKGDVMTHWFCCALPTVLQTFCYSLAIVLQHFSTVYVYYTVQCTVDVRLCGCIMLHWALCIVHWACLILHMYIVNVQRVLYSLQCTVYSADKRPDSHVISVVTEHRPLSIRCWVIHINERDDDFWLTTLYNDDEWRLSASTQYSMCFILVHFIPL